MSRVREAVGAFLGKSVTSQAHLMSQFGWEFDWLKDPAVQRHEFFKSVKDAGRVEEFCDYVLGVENE